MESLPYGEGLTSQVIRTKRSLRIGTSDESAARGAIQLGIVTQSWLGVPILAGDRAVGILGLESTQANLYTEADERLSLHWPPAWGSRSRTPASSTRRSAF